MEIINKSDDELVFKVEIDESLANAIRRYVNQIPILAVNEVEISKNDSPLYDETIAHRIGLIPLKTEGKINSKSKVVLKLNSKKEGYVYSEELKGNADVVYGKIPITSLNKGQELTITAIARLGQGLEHAKFSPGIIYYRNLASVKIPKNCSKEIVNYCPKKILKIKDGKVVAENSEKCDLCESCVDFCKREEKEPIKLEPTKELIITIESFGQIGSKEILIKSIEGLKKDLTQISKNLK